MYLNRKDLYDKLLRRKKYTLFDFIRITFLITPVYSLIYLIDKIIRAFVPVLQIFITALFIDTAINIFKQTEKLQNIYLPLLFLILIIAYKYVDSVIIGIVNSKLDIKVNEVYKPLMIKKCAMLEYKHIENDNTWDIIARACNNPAGRILNGYRNTLQATELIINVLSILVVLFINAWWTAIAIISFSVPLFYLAYKCGQTNYEAFRKVKKYQRRSSYLNSIITGRDSVEERSLFSYTNAVNDMWYKENEKSRIIRLKAERLSFIKMKSASLITVIISILIAGVLLSPLSRGLITAGIYISLVKEVFDLVHTMSWDLSDITQEMANNLEYLKDLSIFTSLSETEKALEIPERKLTNIEFKSIEFKNVSFKYPNTDKYIIKNLSMKLDAKRTYAFVGINGAGKTTITKLLTGMYDNFEGEILINEKSIRKISLPQLKAIFSVIYQDFAKYYISIRENLMLGHIEGVTETEMRQALKAIELDDVVKKYKKGIDTSLGKIRKNSVDISGGQWQRLAIARALVSKAPIQILDEPTASLDPVAESNVYKIFSEISSKKTTILITHRLGAAQIADEILLIDGGKVTERGSHDELMNLSGKYCKMYNSQRSWYI